MHDMTFFFKSTIYYTERVADHGSYFITTLHRSKQHAKEKEKEREKENKMKRKQVWSLLHK